MLDENCMRLQNASHGHQVQIIDPRTKVVLITSHEDKVQVIVLIHEEHFLLFLLLILRLLFPGLQIFLLLLALLFEVAMDALVHRAVEFLAFLDVGVHDFSL
jgi:hypothetical protein